MSKGCLHTGFDIFLECLHCGDKVSDILAGVLRVLPSVGFYPLGNFVAVATEVTERAHVDFLEWVLHGG